MRSVLALLLMLTIVMGSTAQDNSTPWQDSITGQIEALRAGDGAGALSFAGTAFRQQFEAQPEAFYAAVIATGYEPIAQSRSHSFGTSTREGETVVLQAVKFVGADQSLYEALYQMGNEPDVGWRVLGVVLKKMAGIGI